jgi:hypothetical protein
MKDGFGLDTPRLGNACDVVYTPDFVARDIVRHFKPKGRILDPCCGDGAFLKYMPGADWCELAKGRDFFDYEEPVDWIISNPPYSIYNEWFEHSVKIAQNIVYLIPIMKAMTLPRLIAAYDKGGFVETRIYGGGKAIGFPFGFTCGAMHFRRGYKSGMMFSFYGKP